MGLTGLSTVVVPPRWMNHECHWARFSLNPREARARLAWLHREYHTSLQAHSHEVTRLIDIAYGRLGYKQTMDMALETFSVRPSCPPATVQSAMRPQELDEAVCQGNEYLQLHTKPTKPGVVAAYEDEESEKEEDSTVNAVQAATPIEIDLSMKALTEMDRTVTRLEQRQELRAELEPPKPRVCYG